MRPDYCPVANEPCQCICLDGCRIKNNSRKPLTEEQVIQMALDAGFERNSLGWTFTYGRLDYQLTKFARVIERAHGIGGEE